MKYNDQHIINEHTKDAFIRYWQLGLPPGSFCTAVLANDLLSAAHKADHWNKNMLADTVKWVNANAPRGSWGSYDAVQGWLEKNEHFQAYQQALTFDILKETA